MPLSSQADQICTIHTVTRTFETVFSTFDIVTADDTGEDAFFTAIFESRFPEVNIAETSRGHIEAEF